jgi:hypothetical protein
MMITIGTVGMASYSRRYLRLEAGLVSAERQRILLRLHRSGYTESAIGSLAWVL